MGSCLTLGNELSEETHVLTKQDILLGKSDWTEQWGKGTQENSSVTVFYGDGISFQVLFGQSF